MTVDGHQRSKHSRPGRWFRRAAIAGALLALTYPMLFWFLRNPTLLHPSPGERVSVDIARLKQDVDMLAKIEPNRSLQNPEALDEAADAIAAAFAETGCAVERQTFDFLGETYQNVICSFGPPDAPRVILGAHYDVLQHSPFTTGTYAQDVGKAMPGADDNASAVAGILEIARMVAREKPSLRHRLDLVAFTLEEIKEAEGQGTAPPRVNIGSHEYARKLVTENAEVKLMISVEMIGYFDAAPGSQSYPEPLAPLLYKFYPDTADFIGVIGRSFDRRIVSRVRDLMAVSDGMPVYSINAPERFVPAIARSDHSNFWKTGFPAVMVTDTAEFRNPHYHRSTDTPETLDYERMALVVEGLYQVGVQF